MRLGAAICPVAAERRSRLRALCGKEVSMMRTENTYLRILFDDTILPRFIYKCLHTFTNLYTFLHIYADMGERMSKIRFLAL